MVTGEQAAVSRFIEAMPSPALEQVAARLDLNLDELPPPAVSERLEPLVMELWRRDAEHLVGVMRSRAGGGGMASWGSEETLGALLDGRVSHLVFDPEHDLRTSSVSAPVGVSSKKHEPSLVMERAVERAIATGAAVTGLPPATNGFAPRGMAALLRY